MAVRLLGAAFSRLNLTTVSTTRIQWSSLSWLQRQSLLSTTSLTLSRRTVSAAPFITKPNHCTLYSSGLSAAASCKLVPQPLGLTSQIQDLSTSVTCQASLNQMHRTGPVKKKRKNKNPLGKAPFAKGVVLKTLIKKPKKPNSANRKCVLVRLASGKEMIAYVPGEGHNLQEHNIVLVQPGRLRDTPGVKIRCVRGVYDLQHVIKKQH